MKHLTLQVTLSIHKFHKLRLGTISLIIQPHATAL